MTLLLPAAIVISPRLPSCRVSLREAIFTANVARIQVHNMDTSQTFTMRTNAFADLTPQEFAVGRLTKYATWAWGAVRGVVCVGVCVCAGGARGPLKDWETVG